MAVDWTVEADAAAALRARGIESDLSNATLHTFALDAVASIDARVGTRTGIIYNAPVAKTGATYLFLSPPASSVTSVTEDGTDVAADTGYRVVFGGRALERIDAVWGTKPVVTYDAAIDADRYDRLVTDLVKLAMGYQGYAKSISSGDYSQASSLTADGYQRERESIISEVLPSWGIS